jgi:ATP-binding cassette, subfamily B, multidrug efflux pump
VPLAMRRETLEHLASFMDADDEGAMRAAYRLIDAGSPGYETYAAQYPLLADEPIYVREETGRDELERLSEPMARALLVVATLEQARADPALAAQSGGEAGAFDLSRLPPGVDLLTMLGQLPAQQRESMTAMIDGTSQALGETMITQRAIMRVRAEYEALGMDVGRLQSGYIFSTGAVMLVVTLLSAASTISVGYLSARVAAGIGRDLRSDVFRKVESFSGAEFDKFPTASLITRSTNDITQLQMVTMFVVRLVFYAPIIGVGGTIRAIGKGSSMWWTIAVGVLVLSLVIITLVIVVLPKFRIMQRLIDRINLVARENLSGMMVIRAFNMQSFEEERFDRANADLTANSLFIARATAVLMPLMMFIMNVLSVVILWVGADQGCAGQHAGRRRDGLPAVHDADRLFLLDDVHAVHHPAPGPGCGLSYRRCAGNGADHPRSGAAQSAQRILQRRG